MTPPWTLGYPPMKMNSVSNSCEGLSKMMSISHPNGGSDIEGCQSRARHAYLLLSSLCYGDWVSARPEPDRNGSERSKLEPGGGCPPVLSGNPFQLRVTPMLANPTPPVPPARLGEIATESAESPGLMGRPNSSIWPRYSASLPLIEQPRPGHFVPKVRDFNRRHQNLGTSATLLIYNEANVGGCAQNLFPVAPLKQSRYEIRSMEQAS
jgi:hypothetical protein